MANSIADLILAWSDFKTESITAWKNLKADTIQSVKGAWDNTVAGFKLVRESMRQVSFDPIMNWARGVREKNAILKESYGSLGNTIEKLQRKIEKSTNTKDIEKYTKELGGVQKAAAKHPGNLAAEKSKGTGGTILGAVGGLLGKVSPMGILKSVVSKNFKGKDKGGDDADPASAASLDKAGSESGGQGLATVDDKWKSFQGQINDGIGQIGLAFLPVLNRLLDFGLKISDTLLPMIMTAISPLMEIINSLPIEALLENVLTIVGAIITAIGPIIEQLKPLFDSIFEMLTPLMQNITDFIVVLVEGLAPIFALIAHIASAVLGPALVFIGKILGVVINIVKWIAKIAMAILKPIIDFVALLIDGIMWLFGQSNEFSGKDTTGKMLKPVDPKKDTTFTATEAGAQMDKGLAGAAKTTTPTAINTGQSTHTKSATKTGSEVTSGGPRVININGVKFAEKIELSVISAKEGINHLEAQLQEMFLRILNSGAVIQ